LPNSKHLYYRNVFQPFSNRITFLKFGETKTFKIIFVTFSGKQVLAEPRLKISVVCYSGQYQLDWRNLDPVVEGTEYLLSLLNIRGDGVGWEVRGFLIQGVQLVNGQNRCQFHQRFTQSFYTRRSRKCKKIQLSHQYLFTLSGIARVKAVSRMLMKLSPCAFHYFVGTYLNFSIRLAFSPWKFSRNTKDKVACSKLDIKKKNIYLIEPFTFNNINNKYLGFNPPCWSIGASSGFIRTDLLVKNPESQSTSDPMKESIFFWEKNTFFKACFI